MSTPNPQPPPGYGSANLGSAPYPYAGYAVPPVGPKNAFGIASLVIAIIALLFAWSGGGGLILGLLAVIFGVIGRRRIKRGEANRGRIVIAGIAIGFVAIIVSSTFLAFFLGRSDVYIGRYLNVGDSEFHDCIFNADDNAQAGRCRRELREREDREDLDHTRPAAFTTTP